MLFFGCVVISDLYLFQETVLLNPFFDCAKNLILSFIDKVTAGTQRSALYIWNAVPVVFVTSTVLSQDTAAVLDVSDIIQFFVHLKSSSTPLLIKGKSIDLQMLLKYLNGTTTSASNLPLPAGALPVIFVLY